MSLETDRGKSRYTRCPEMASLLFKSIRDRRLSLQAAGQLTDTQPSLLSAILKGGTGFPPHRYEAYQRAFPELKGVGAYERIRTAGNRMVTALRLTEQGKAKYEELSKSGEPLLYTNWRAGYIPTSRFGAEPHADAPPNKRGRGKKKPIQRVKPPRAKLPQKKPRRAPALPGPSVLALPGNSLASVKDELAYICLFRDTEKVREMLYLVERADRLGWTLGQLAGLLNMVLYGDKEV